MNIPNIPSTASVAFLCTVMDVFMVFLSLAVQLQCVLPLLSSRRIYVRVRSQAAAGNGCLRGEHCNSQNDGRVQPIWRSLGLRSIEQS